MGQVTIYLDAQTEAKMLVPKRCGRSLSGVASASVPK